MNGKASSGKAAIDLRAHEKKKEDENNGER